MKKMTITTLICALVFCIVCTACNNAAGGKPQKPVDSQKPTESQNPADPKKPTESPSTRPAVPEGIAEKLFSELSAEQQAEVKTLYGYYWAQNGSKGECPAINAERIAVYNASSESMSVEFINVRWAQISPSAWVCFSYAFDENDYVPENRRFIFVFSKGGDGTVKVWDTIILMDETYGPYIKGKEPEKVIEGGKTYYRYDSKSPKLFEPTLK